MAQGIFGRRPTFDVPEDIAAMASAPVPRQKLFDRSMLGNILGGVADVVSQHSGFAPTFAPMQAEKRRMSMMEQARAQELADYERKQQIEAQYKTVSPNDTERDYNFILQQAGKNAADQWLKNRYDPIVTVDEVQNGATVRSFRPRSELTGDVLGNVSQPAPIAGSQEPMPSREEYGRFVNSLVPGMRERAWAAYNSGNLGGIPMGSPVGAPAPRGRPSFTIKPAPTKDPVKPRMSTLKIGTVIGDKEYIGGNPKSPSSWRKK